MTKHLHPKTRRKTKPGVTLAPEAEFRLLADLVHDLRTPLSSITLWAALIDEPKGVDLALLKEGLAAIKQGAAELHERLEELSRRGPRRPLPRPSS